MGPIVKEWKITGSRGNIYIITKDSLGDVECTCPDYYYRRRFMGGFCKHIQKVVSQEGETQEPTYDDIAREALLSN